MATMTFEKNLDTVCKQIISKNNSSYSGFYLLVGLCTVTISLVLLVITKTVKFIIKKVKERREMSELRQKQEQEHLRCKGLLAEYLMSSNGTLSFDIMDTVTNKFNETKQHINFYGFNNVSMKIDNINELVNGVLYNTLEVETKGKLKDTIVVDAKDVVTLADDIGREYDFKVHTQYIR